MLSFSNDFTLAVLITYRLAHAIANETGPARILRHLRGLPRDGTTLHEGLHCQLCSSFWLAWGVVACFASLRRRYLANALAVAVAVAVAGAVLVIDRAIYVR